MLDSFQFSITDESSHMMIYIADKVKYSWFRWGKVLKMSAYKGRMTNECCLQLFISSVNNTDQYINCELSFIFKISFNDQNKLFSKNSSWITVNYTINVNFRLLKKVDKAV